MFLSSLLIALALPLAGSAQMIEMRPVCEAVGTRSEGWYQSGIRVDFAKCAGCLSSCMEIGTAREGWYNWCDKTLITIDRCASSLPVFSDIPERHPLYPAIHFAASVGLVEGYPVTRAGKDVREYRPLARINRAEFTKIIMGALFERERIDRCDGVTFSDADPDAWYAPSLCMAKEQGVIMGYPNGTFRPDRDVSFVEAAAILARAFALLPPMPVPSDPWYRAPVDALAMRRAIPPSIASFDHPLTRGDMVDIYHRLQVPDPLRPILTYDALVVLSAPPPSSSPSSAASQAAAASQASAAVASVRYPHAGGLFSVELPSTWQSVQRDGSRAPLTTIEAGVPVADPAAEGGFGMGIDVFLAAELGKPVDAPFFPFLQQMILPTLQESDFQTTAYNDWSIHTVSPPPAPDARQAYYVFFVRGDTAILFSFPGEDARTAAIVASFQWAVSSSASSASSVLSPSSPSS